MPKTRLTHHLVALWFADVAGYSDFAAKDEPGAMQLIELLQTLSRETVGRHQGRIVKFMGDAVLAEFSSTEMAVRAAALLSKRFAEQSAGSARVHNLRIGVHIADVAVDSDGDLYGDGVNAAARLQEAAEPGPKPMLPSARHSPSNGSSKMPRPNLREVSSWIPLPSMHTIFMRGLHSKQEISRRRPACLKRHTDRDGKIIRQ